MDSEKRLTLVMMAVLFVLVAVLLTWRYAIQPRLQRRAERRQKQETVVRKEGARRMEQIGGRVVTQGAAHTPVRAVEQRAEEVPTVAGETVQRARVEVAGARVAQAVNLLRNSNFGEGLQGWWPWPPGTALTNHVRVVGAEGAQGASYALRIEGSGGELIGMQQVVRLETGRVYRLRAQVRSVLTNDSTIMFGGRVACYMAGRPEVQLVWMSEYQHWWPKEVVFTNTDFDGVAVVYAHMGYGKFASTGEFTDIRLEELP